MPTVTLLTDASPHFPLLFAAIQAQEADLTRQGCVMPAAQPWREGAMRSHQFLWNAAHQGRNGPELAPFWKPCLHQLLDGARQGRDILLYGRELNPEKQQLVLALLRSCRELAGHAFRIVGILGRPALLLEQISRLALSPLCGSDEWNARVRRCSRLPSLVAFWKQSGADELRLFCDSAASPLPVAWSQGHAAALACLGISPIQPPAHPLFLASREALHFHILREVGNNAWPPLEETAFLNFLQEEERREGWDTLPLSPPEHRARLEPPAARLARLLDMPESAFAAPAWLSTAQDSGDPPAHDPAPSPAQAWTAYTGLSDAAVAAFARDLPAPLAETLRARFRRDRKLLVPGQQRMARALDPRPLPSRVEVEEETPLVCVLTLTRNHRMYIGACIESVLAQQAPFRIRHIIVDHCSTDGTAQIIREYAQNHPSVHPVLLSQWLSGQNVRALFRRCHSRYAALCDGDDYFTDPLKLRKQVDFLEAHPDCALCFHPVDVLYEDGSPPRVYPPETMLPRGVRRFYTLRDLLVANIMQTNSVMYRWRFSEGLPDWFDATLIPGDWYWHLLHAETGLIGYQPDHMSVYRRHAASLYASAEGNHVDHRKAHGLDELRAYHVCNEHFQGRYYADFQRLAAGVLVDFLTIYARTDDNTLLLQAADRYPNFTRDFLNQIRKSAS